MALLLQVVACDDAPTVPSLDVDASADGRSADATASSADFAVDSSGHRRDAEPGDRDAGQRADGPLGSDSGQPVDSGPLDGQPALHDWGADALQPSDSGGDVHSPDSSAPATDAAALDGEAMDLVIPDAEIDPMDAGPVVDVGLGRDASGGPDADGFALCVSDRDGDGICDAVDNCPEDANAAQVDLDGDGRGDSCDRSPAVFDYTLSGQLLMIGSSGASAGVVGTATTGHHHGASPRFRVNATLTQGRTQE